MSFVSAAGAACLVACDAPGGGGGGAGGGDASVTHDSSGDTVTLPAPAVGPAVQVTQYCDRYAQVGCAAASACGCLASVGGNLALCDAYVKGKCADEVAGPVAAGAYTFDPARAGQCLAAAQQIVADCVIDDRDVLLYLASHCEDFLAGARRAGDACADDGECLAPLACHDDVCTALPTDGRPCLDGSTCADDCYCDPQDVCHTIVRSGGSCADASYACADDLYCDSRSSTCQPAIAQGQACAHATYACTGDRYCDSRTDTCAPPIASGLPCGHATWACADRLMCDAASETCRPYPGVGQSCANSAGSCADHLYCDDAAVCRQAGPNGAACTSDDACLSENCDGGACASSTDLSEVCSLL